MCPTTGCSSFRRLFLTCFVLRSSVVSLGEEKPLKKYCLHLRIPKAFSNCHPVFSATGNPWLEHDLEPSSWTIASDAVFGPQLQDLRFARCCRSEWLERPKSPLSLLEAAAAVLVEQGQWTKESLPACLHGEIVVVLVDGHRDLFSLLSSTTRPVDSVFHFITKLSCTICSFVSSHH